MASSAPTSHSSDDLSLGLLNIDGLRNKIPDVRYIMSERQLQVLALCETKLDSTVKGSKLYIPGYRMWKKDRNRHRGGVALYIQDHIPTKLRSDLMNPEVEIIWVEMKLPDSRPVVVGCCYRPPGSTADYLNQILEMMNQVSQEDRDIFLLGDFNIDWFADSEEKKKLQSQRGWTQIVTIETRKTPKTFTCIDHIYTNTPDSRFKPISIITGCSDHNVITVRVSKKIPKMKYLEWDIFNHKSFIRDLKKARWSDVTNEADPQKALNKFKDILFSFPKKHTSINIYDLLRVDEKLQRLITKRDKAKCNNTKRYKYLKKEVYKQSNKQQTERFREQIIDAENDCNKIFEIFNRFFGYNLPSRVIDIKSLESLEFRRAEFQKYQNQIQIKTDNLQSVFDGFETQTEKKTFRFKEVKPQMIKTLLLSLCESGIIDQSEAELFRLAADVISAPICHILNRCIINNLFPPEWNKVKNISYQTNKYSFIREINCLIDFVLRLIFDRILLQQIKQYFTDKKWILLASLHDELKEIWLKEIKNRKTVLCFSSDFSSSFDTIRHDLLLHKLKQSSGFSSSALKLIKSFLSDRSAGLPRGSFFSHFLFRIYTNDLRRVLKNSSVVMSDNEFHIYCSDKNTQKSKQLLKADIKSVTKWADENGLILNKTEPIHLENSDQIDQSFNLLTSVQYCIHGQINWIRVLTVILLNENRVWTNVYDTILEKLEKGFTKAILKVVSKKVKADVINSLTLLQFLNSEEAAALL